MAATNFTPIILYHTTTASAAPTAGNLNNGELAINITDGKLFYKDNGGTVQVIATKGTGTIGGSTTQVQYNNAGALAGSANFTFNGTTATINTLNLTNALGTAYGGTALTTYTQGDLVYASAANTLAKLGIGANTYILTSTGSVPQWSAPSAVTVSTANNLAGGAAGSVPYQSGAGVTTFLSIGTANQVLTSSGTAPQWSNLSSLGVSSLSFGTTGLTPSTATQGAITVAGTLATTNGGTGLTSFTANGVVYASSSSALATGSALTFDGTTLGLTTTGTNALTINTPDYGYVDLKNGTSTLRFQNNNSIPRVATVGNYPLVFAINEVEQARLTSTGLGIGVSSPSQKLAVAGNISVGATGNNGIQFHSGSPTGSNLEWWVSNNQGASNELNFYYYSGGVFAGNAMSITKTGNVGIGTSSPSTNLEVSGGSAVARISGTSGTVPQLSLSSAGVVNWTLRSNNDGGSDFTIYQDATQRLKIDSNGYVGIRTSSPAGFLHVAPGSAAAASTAGAPIILQAQTGGSSASGGNILIGSGQNGSGGSNGYIAFGIGSSTSGSAFATGEAVRITSAGDFLVATTTNSNNARAVITAYNVGRPALEVQADFDKPGISFNGGPFIRSDGKYAVLRTPIVASGDNSIYFETGTGGDANITFITNGVTRGSWLGSNGNLLVDNSAPISDTNLKVQLNVTSGNTQRFFSVNNNGDYGLIMGFLYNDQANIRTVWNYPLVLGTNNAERLRITPAGYVGIGTSNPGTTLDVAAGTSPGIRVQQNYTFGGTNYALSVSGDGATAGYLSQNPAAGGMVVADGMRYYGGGPWTPDSTSAESMQMLGGNIIFTSNTGLTGGVNFTPTERARLTAAGDWKVTGQVVLASEITVQSFNKSLTGGGATETVFTIAIGDIYGDGIYKFTVFAVDATYPNGNWIQEIYVTGSREGLGVVNTAITQQDKVLGNNGIAYPTWSISVSGNSYLVKASYSYGAASLYIKAEWSASVNNNTTIT